MKVNIQYMDGMGNYTTLSETNIAPENRWLEYDSFLLGRLGRGELLVSTILCLL